MENTSKSRQVLVVDGTPLTRFAIVTLINLHPLLRVCGEAGDAPQARRCYAEQKPDLVVLDLIVPRGDGIELLRDFRKLHETGRALVISDREDPLSLRRAFRAGAHGYVSKQEEPGEVIAALETVVTGGLFASRRVSHLLLEQMTVGTVKGIDRELASLSDRELQVFRLLGEGLGSTAIARELGVSIKTIETHQQRMKNKLHIATCAELHRQAERWLSQQASGLRNPPKADRTTLYPLPSR